MRSDSDFSLNMMHCVMPQDTKHEAHSIKGAAANLMCHRLRTAAAYLEQGGQVGTRLEKGETFGMTQQTCTAITVLMLYEMNR